MKATMWTSEVSMVWLVAHQQWVVNPISPHHMQLPSHSVLIQRGHLPHRGMELFMDRGKPMVRLLSWNQFPRSSHCCGPSKIPGYSIV